LKANLKNGEHNARHSGNVEIDPIMELSMKILFAAPEKARGGLLDMLREELPEHQIDATGAFRIDSLKGYDVVIPCIAPVTAELIIDADRLKLIQQGGAGLDSVNLDAAKAHNIKIANVPTDLSGASDSVAELGIYFMLGLLRDYKSMTENLTNRKMGEPLGKTLMGRTVGIVGLGSIGRAVARRLKNFDVRLIGIKQINHEEAIQELGLKWAGGSEDLPILLEQSDVVVLCLPLTEKSNLMMNKSAFNSMKRDSFLINLSRGGLVDRPALEDALDSGKIAGAGLDVFWEEPPDPADPIFNYNVIAAPHIGDVTDTAIKGIVKAVAENIRRVERKEFPLNCIN
jgi:phosphoglycerate dehydrogenase-like enzyme